MATIEQTHAQKAPALKAIRALAFDVQGTCVDFYQPILRMGEAVNRAKGLDIDWAALSSEWRDLYRMALDQVIAGRRPWLRVDRIYREALDTLLERRGISGVFTTAERDELNQIWTRLDPWPEASKDSRDYGGVSSHPLFPMRAQRRWSRWSSMRVCRSTPC